MMKHIISLLIFFALIAINQWLSLYFGFKTSYLKYYLDNGSLIGLITAVVVISWGDLNKNVGLISPEPHTYLSACFRVIRLPASVLSNEIDEFNEKWAIVTKGYRYGVVGFKLGDLWMFWDIIIGPLFLLPIIAGLVIWLFLVAPLQYFTFIFAGAPARSLGLFATKIDIAQLKDNELKIKRIEKNEIIPEGWWDASFSQKPIVVTALISSLILWVVNFAV
jgi:hypothetical protein